jgi:uncharacterized protein
MEATPSHSLMAKINAVRAQLSGFDKVVVAFSGGVDSTLLLALALEQLGEHCLAVTTVSPSLASHERAAAERMAAQLGARHRLIETAELELESYASNPPDRCFYCKDALFAQLAQIAKQDAGAVLLFGANADDASDKFRPGHRAAHKHGAVAPLLDAQLTKHEIRQASRWLRLETWNKPQLACLASRIPYGTRISAERLAQIEQAEAALLDLGFVDVRVRYHDDIARIEVGSDELSRFSDPKLRQSVAEAIHGAGFRYATVDLDGFRSGRLNEALTPTD